jgi:hypothetical protein
MGKCSNCWKFDTEKCPECSGFGGKDYGGFGLTRTCPKCEGSGKICSNCGKAAAK